MRVRALRPHGNQHGEAYAKDTGDEYEHPDPAGDIACGVVTDASVAPAGGEEEAPFADLGVARKAYRATFGKNPGPKWDVATIAQKIAEREPSED